MTREISAPVANDRQSAQPDSLNVIIPITMKISPVRAAVAACFCLSVTACSLFHEQ
jgi:hypothetical protein